MLDDGFYIVEVGGVRYIAERIRGYWYPTGIEHDIWAIQGEEVKVIACVFIDPTNEKIVPLATTTDPVEDLSQIKRTIEQYDAIRSMFKPFAKRWYYIGQGDIVEDFEAAWKRSLEDTDNSGGTTT